MKINFILPHIRLSGGVKLLFEYANRLKRKGHEVRVFVPSKVPKWYQLRDKWRKRKNLFNFRIFNYASKSWGRYINVI